MLRSEVLANRQKVITFLKQPKRIKTKSALDTGQGARCCLGHMAYCLNVPRKKYTSGFKYGVKEHVGIAPAELFDLVGLYNNTGGASTFEVLKDLTVYTLAELNDSTDASPQEIGKYLESVVGGGHNTPWRPLTDYLETT